ncbi:MAG TPA: lysophospholipid acyltransferase family protein [Armatimonadota bacterium]|jgi:1-acyl-sn-glycerol-3-phosphate acyltransferase
MQVAIVHNFCKRVLAVVTRTMGPIHIYGMENVPAEGPVIIASNHQSYLDPIVIALPFKRPMQAIAKKYLFKIPVFAQIIDLMGAFPVDPRSGLRGAIRASLEVLEKGRPLLIFVEGKRTRGVFEPPQAGVAMIARKSGAPVIPTLVTGTHKAFSPDHPGFHRSHFTVTFGKPMYFCSDEKRPDLDADARSVMAAIAALRAETPDAWPELHEEDLPPERA